MIDIAKTSKEIKRGMEASLFPQDALTRWFDVLDQYVNSADPDIEAVRLIVRQIDGALSDNEA